MCYFWNLDFQISYCHNLRKSKYLVLSEIQKFRNHGTHKYFTFDHHISSFISLITYVFLVSQTFGFCTYLWSVKWQLQIFYIWQLLVFWERPLFSFACQPYEKKLLKTGRNTWGISTGRNWGGGYLPADLVTLSKSAVWGLFLPVHNTNNDYNTKVWHHKLSWATSQWAKRTGFSWYVLYI